MIHELDKEALLPCPFCGGNDLRSGGDDKVVGSWCQTCSAVGPDEYGKYGWNTRARPTLPEGAVEAAARAICRTHGHDLYSPTCDVYVEGDPDAIYPWAGFRRAAQAALYAGVPALMAENERLRKAADTSLYRFNELLFLGCLTEDAANRIREHNIPILESALSTPANMGEAL